MGHENCKQNHYASLRRGLRGLCRSSALIGRLPVLPVSLSDAADRRQLPHQQLEDGGFTGPVFSHLTVNTTRPGVTPTLFTRPSLFCATRT